MFILHLDTPTGVVTKPSHALPLQGLTQVAGRSLLPKLEQPPNNLYWEDRAGRQQGVSIGRHWHGMICNSRFCVCAGDGDYKRTVVEGRNLWTSSRLTASSIKQDITHLLLGRILTKAFPASRHQRSSSEGIAAGPLYTRKYNCSRSPPQALKHPPLERKACNSVRLCLGSPIPLLVGHGFSESREVTTEKARPVYLVEHLADGE